MIKDPLFKNKFKKDKKSFIRERKLPFSSIIILLLRKSVKSLQNSLNEFFNKLDANLTTASNSAFSQARHKLSYEAFIELNRAALLPSVYKSDSEYNTYKGLRVLSIDSSKIYLPNSKDIESEFGLIKNTNQTGKVGYYSGGLVSILYDVLNDIAIDSKLVSLDNYEGDLAIEHLDYCTQNDLIIGDRGYPSYKFMAHMHQKGTHFLLRCSKKSFKESQSMFYNDIDSKIVTLKRTKKCTDRALADEIKVRFIKVILNTGEIEVLVTSLLDENHFPSREFKELYWKRWGIETFYDILKNRLNLENFTGKSVEAVKQDFYSTICISNLESIITEDAEEILDHRSMNVKNKLQVNKSVSFNAVKNNIIDLVLSDNNNDIDELLYKMTELFLQSPTAIRKNRSFERKSNSRSSLNYHKRKNKICF